MTDLVSIITPMYNSEAFIEETIKSVIHQSYEKWEMLIIDDGSIDNSINIVKHYVERDKRIKLIEKEKNQGAAIARNIGIREFLEVDVDGSIYTAYSQDKNHVYKLEKGADEASVVLAVDANVASGVFDEFSVFGCHQQISTCHRGAVYVDVRKMMKDAE